MIGATLPGNSTVEFKEFDIPKPGHGQVLIQTMASTICGSDIRCIYREHTGKGAEGYIDGTIAGHEPCGIIIDGRGRASPFSQGRPRDCLSHQRMRPLLRLPPWLCNLLHLGAPAGLWLAAQWRDGAVSPSRRKGSDSAAG